MNADEILIFDAIAKPHDGATLESIAATVAGAARLHTPAFWLATAQAVIVDRARLAEARLTIEAAQ